jgi:pyrroloquinoline quinone biosynthesis protein B
MGRLTAIVLGAAAGGGFPQWNCLCSVCRLAWAGDARVKPRTQTSLAVSADRQNWVVVNAAPDLRAQVQATPPLHPPQGPRASPIASVILTGAEIDQVAGLLSLRERQRFALYASAQTLAALDANPMFGVLAHDVVARRAVAPGERFTPALGIEAELIAVPGKAPLYLEGASPELASESGVNVGVELMAHGRSLMFIPGAAAVPPSLKERLARADLVMFDGTLFSDDEMTASGTGQKTGRRMGHMPIDGEGGSLAELAGLSNRRIYIHVNNTNPILIDGSPQRRKVEAAGWQVAEDGMEIVV